MQDLGTNVTYWYRMLSRFGTSSLAVALMISVVPAGLVSKFPPSTRNQSSLFFLSNWEHSKSHTNMQEHSWLLEDVRFPCRYGELCVAPPDLEDLYQGTCIDGG